jgi:uncharacterized membrane protein
MRGAKTALNCFYMMRPDQKDYVHNLMNIESQQLKKLNSIVSEAVKEEELLLQKITRAVEEKSTFGQRLSDKVARFGGSWSFIIIFSAILLAWIIFNTMLPAKKQFDPYPFILMNLVLSSIAALQAPIIMMSQNRQQNKDREQAINDYMINLKAEIEIRTLHQKMDLLLQEQFKKLFETQAEQIRLLQKISEKQ